MDWQPIETAPLNEVVNTLIADEQGPRNIQPLIAVQRAPGCRVMWFFPDKSMYVYYAPTHWRHLEQRP